MLAVGDDGVEIDELYVTPEARGRRRRRPAGRDRAGRGRARVAWIVADDDGLARALYERLGFETVWLQHASSSSRSRCDSLAG